MSAIVGVEPSGQQVPAGGWSLSLYPTAGEAGGSFRYRQRRWTASGGPAGDPQRARDEAARRARANVRRYCAANGLNRLGTLTYAGAGCHDASALRPDVADFFRRLRRALGNRPLPYLWTAEWHPGGHGLHVHFAVGRYVPQPLIRSTWGRGHVSIKLLGDLPVGASPREEARAAARYLSKYVGKAFDGRRASGLHRLRAGPASGPRGESAGGGRHGADPGP